MERIPFQVEQSLVDNPPKIFGDVKFLVEGNVDQKIIKLLENGGATRISYAGLNATHMIAGDGADEGKLSEAEEVFEVPVVQPRWVVFSAKAGKLLPINGFGGQSKRLFSGLKICCAKLQTNDRNALWANITNYGGEFQHNLTRLSTHLVTNQTGCNMYTSAMKHNKKIVCCDWITDCINAGSLLDEAKYHPQLLISPSSLIKDTPAAAAAPPVKVEVKPQLKTETSTPTAQSKAILGSQGRQSLKVSASPANVRQPAPQAPTILQVQLSGNQNTNGPRGRGVAIRQSSQPILVQPKQQAGPTNVRAHRPLLVNTPPQPTQKSKVNAAPSQLPPPPQPVQTVKQTQPQQSHQPPGGTPQQQQQNQSMPPVQQQEQVPSNQQQSNQLQMALQQPHAQQQQNQVTSQANQMTSIQQSINVQSGQLGPPLPSLPPPPQQQQQSQVQNSQQQQQHNIQLQQQMTSIQQQQQQQSSLQQQQQQQQHQQQQHHPSQLHQQLQGQLHIQQHQQLQIQQQSNQLQSALSQQNQQNSLQNIQTQPPQLQLIQHPSQTNMPLHLRPPQQQSVLQNQLQQIQIHPNQQQIQHLQQQQQQHNVQHTHTTLSHPQNQTGMQQGHMQPQQGMQIQGPPQNQQGHPMHMQMQGQMGGQPHQGGMQFSQHNQQQQLLQQQQHQHQLQLQQQQHHMQQNQQTLQSQGVLQPQKSPLPIQSPAQPMQTGQPQMHIQQQTMSQQSGIQLGISPLQGLQNQQYQIQNQNQLHQQQQFISPPKTPPQQQMHPQQSPQQQHQQMMQGSMRPPPQPGQQQQSVQFQILQPQNRLQVVMGIPQKPQYQSQQNQQGNISIANQQYQQQQQQQQQQQPHPQQVFRQGIKPQMQMQMQMQQQQQGPQPGHPPTSHSQTGPVGQLQPILQPQQLSNKFQEIGPSSGQQVQQGAQHYNVVIHQGQQYAQMNPPPRPPPGSQQRHPGKPGAAPNQQPQVGQRLIGMQPRPGSHQWTPQQQMEIYRQIHMDPVIKAKWTQMDQQQRQLLLQKLAQRHKEEALRKEMLLRQQQMNQQNAAIQNQSQGQTMVAQPLQVPGSPQHGQQQPQTILVQQGVPPQSPGGEKPMGMQPQQQNLVPQPTPSPLSQSGSPQLPQQGQIPGSPGTPVNHQQQHQMLMQNQLLAQQQNQQKMLNPRAQSPTQKFPPPVQTMQTRSPTHPGIPGQQPQASGTIVRTQQVFTPQVAQHGPQPQQQRMVIVHQGGPGGIQQQQARFPQHQIILQQGQGQPIPTQQKVAILQGPHQSPGSQSGSQWIAGSPQPQRLGSPTQSTTQFPPRMQSPDAQQRSPGQVWNVRAQPPTLITPGSPGTPNAAPYVQVVNSKTKTALANLLNNRLQGNSTGIDSNTTTSTTGSAMVTPSTSTTLTMSPSLQNLPVSSSQSQQLPLQHPVTQPSTQSLNVVNQRRTLSNLTNSCKTIHQVNSYGAAAVRAGSLSQSPTSVAISSTRTPFYGYEPSFKAPPNGFLVGCTFWAAQTMPQENWRYIVVVYGGEVLTEYNASKVTHVLCNNQKFAEWPQVMKDGKRLVTLHWLSDTCLRKVMAPPFYAMHLPTPFNEESLPLKGLPFATTGFDGEDRERVVRMLMLLGASWTPYFTKLNKGLVACRSEGSKFLKAREWKLPVVNIQFLNELILGNITCLQMMHSPKYQQFTLDQPFRFDINISPHLMTPWKTPIRVSNDNVEKFKTGKRSLEFDEENIERTKRLKVMEDEKSQLSYLSELVTGEDVPNAQDDIENRRPPVIMFSGFTEKFKKMAKEKVIAIGGRVTEELKDSTHLVCWQIVTAKLYIALCRVKFIVGAPWIRDSIKAKRFVDETPYICTVETFEKYHKKTVAEILKLPDRHSLFKGMTFFITPGIVGKTRQDLEKIIEAAGGQNDRLQRSMADVRSKTRKNPRKYIVITSEEDYEFFSDFFYHKASKPLSVFTFKFLYNSIAEQKIDFGPMPIKKSIPKVVPA